MNIDSDPRPLARPEKARGVVAAFVDSCQQRAQYVFTGADLAKHTTQTPLARRKALWRLQKLGRIVRPLPKRDFFVVVPHEHHSMGAPPSVWYLDPLMRYLDCPSYYAGLLTAAQWHGASHFAIQETQVVVSKQLRPIRVGREKIRFITKVSAPNTPVEVRKLETGSVRVSTPEATAADLIRYPEHTGGLSTAATAIAEMSRKFSESAILEAVTRDSNPAVAQRLGFILEMLRERKLTEKLIRWVAKADPSPRPLVPGEPVENSTFNKRWRLWINAKLEISA